MKKILFLAAVGALFVYLNRERIVENIQTGIKESRIKDLLDHPQAETA